MQSLSTHISNTSELLRDFAWFLDNTEDSHVAEAAELFAHYRRDEHRCCGLFGAAFDLFALSDMYEDGKERKLRMGLAMACNELAKEGPENEAAFLLEALNRAGYLGSWERPKPEKKPLWLAWIDAMDELEVLKGAVPDELKRQAFAQAALLFAKDAPIERVADIHDKLSHVIGLTAGTRPFKIEEQPAGGAS